MDAWTDRQVEANIGFFAILWIHQLLN